MTHEIVVDVLHPRSWYARPKRRRNLIHHAQNITRKLPSCYFSHHAADLDYEYLIRDVLDRFTSGCLRGPLVLR